MSLYEGLFWIVTLIVASCFIIFVTVELYEVIHDWNSRRQYRGRS